MEEPPFTLTPPKWGEDNAVAARTFFSTADGQRMLQKIRYDTPNITASTSDERRTQHERRQGYEDCFREIFALLKPTS